jgi:hypothetical protein
MKVFEPRSPFHRLSRDKNRREIRKNKDKKNRKNNRLLIRNSRDSHRKNRPSHRTHNKDLLQGNRNPLNASSQTDRTSSRRKQRAATCGEFHQTSSNPILAFNTIFTSSS